jgi:hypothetical protein
MRIPQARLSRDAMAAFKSFSDQLFAEDSST